MLASSLALLGCYAPLARENPWEGLRRASDGVVEPLPLPDLPTPIVLERDGQELVAFDGEGRRSLLELVEVAEANTQIADELRSALQEQDTAYNALVDAGAAEYRLSEMREEMLREERRARFVERIGHWVLIGVLGVASLSD